MAISYLLACLVVELLIASVGGKKQEFLQFPEEHVGRFSVLITTK